MPKFGEMSPSKQTAFMDRLKEAYDEGRQIGAAEMRARAAQDAENAHCIYCHQRTFAHGQRIRALPIHGPTSAAEREEEIEPACLHCSVNADGTVYKLDPNCPLHGDHHGEGE